MPKTQEQLDWIYNNAWKGKDGVDKCAGDDTIMFVGLEKFVGEWTWLDNTTFTGT